METFKDDVVTFKVENGMLDITVQQFSKYDRGVEICFSEPKHIPLKSQQSTILIPNGAESFMLLCMSTNDKGSTTTIRSQGYCLDEVNRLRAKDAYEFLRNKTFFVATIENGKPIQRPFGAIMWYEKKLYIVTSNTKNVYKQIIANPNISLCASESQGLRRWVRISGIAKKDDNRKAKKEMLTQNPILSKHYESADDKSMAIFYIDKPTVEFN